MSKYPQPVSNIIMETQLPITTTGAFELKERLQLLHTEHATASLDGIDGNGLYMADLRAEMDATRAAYVGAAVTEIASLRSALSGPLQG
jgi:hypothetical protein